MSRIASLRPGEHMINNIESRTLLNQYVEIQNSELPISEVTRQLKKQDIHSRSKQDVSTNDVIQKQLHNILCKVLLFISKSEGGYKNTALSNWTTDYQGLVKEFSAPIIGDKDGSYYTRCTGTKRNNADTSNIAHVLILDGDSRIDEGGEILPGAPEPLLVHEILKSLDIQHLIYTSHSNGTGLHKYRVVIPCEYSPEQLPILLGYLFNKLQEANVMLAPVPENRTWSQPWYFPRVPDEPRKALFEFYAHDGALLAVETIYQEWLIQQPEAEPPPYIPYKPQQNENLTGWRNPIKEFNQSNRLHDVLIRNGYIKKGKNYLRPDSSSKIPAVQVCLNCADDVERVFSHGGDMLNDGYAHDTFDCYRLLECGGDLSTALGWRPEITKHNQRLYKQEQAKLKQEQTSKPKLLSPAMETNPDAVINQSVSLIKQDTINKLLNKVITVDFKNVCLKLGWTLVHNKDGSEKPPLQKHYKVSIIDQLLQVAHANEWHLVRDSGISYIYTGCMWLSLDKDELKNLLNSTLSD